VHAIVSYIIGCYEIYTNRQAVIIFSPSYPRVYSPFYNCVWKITNKKRQFYQMEISNFNLNYSPDCVHDYLKISDHANKLVLPNNGRLCGIHKQITIVSRTSDLTIHFRSQARGGTGFKLVYWQLPERKRRYTMIDGTLIWIFCAMTTLCNFLHDRISTKAYEWCT